jgi:hypothetical protein
MRATLGEVFLIQRKYPEAGHDYKAAVALARAEEGSHLSTWTQACRLMAKLNRPTPTARSFATR